MYYIKGVTKVKFILGAVAIIQSIDQYLVISLQELHISKITFHHSEILQDSLREMEKVEPPVRG